MIRQRLFLISSVTLLVLLASCANTAEHRQVAGSQSITTQAESESERTFITTGTRISRDVPRDRRGYGKGAFPVSVFSREELERTGLIDVGRALRRVDPAFR